MPKPTKGKSFSYRLRRDFEPLMDDLCGALDRDKSYFLDKALEKLMPEWEERYAVELEEYRRNQASLSHAAPITKQVSPEAVKKVLHTLKSQSLKSKSK